MGYDSNLDAFSQGFKKKLHPDSEASAEPVKPDPKSGEDASKQAADSKSSGGVFDTLMEQSINLGGALGGQHVYDTIKKVMKK